MCCAKYNQILYCANKQNVTFVFSWSKSQEAESRQARTFIGFREAEATERQGCKEQVRCGRDGECVRHGGREGVLGAGDAAPGR